MYLGNLTTKQFWSARHTIFNKKQFQNYKLFAHKILRKYLKHNPNLSLIEVGCAPGRNLVYFAKNFGYQVAGIEFSDKIHDVEATLKLHGVDNFTLIHQDFFLFKSADKYDIVFSHGFVEHFTETSLVFQRHVDLLTDNGILIITVPNLRYGQYVLRYFLGARSSFDWHNLQVMFPSIWRNLAEESGLKVLYCNYYQTFDFWLPQERNRFLRLACRAITKLLVNILNILHLGNIPNRWFSPYMLLIATKTEGC